MMNVKKQIFEKNNKQNSSQNLASIYQIPSIKQRGNIGEQIRKKLRIKPNTSDSLNVLMPRDDNAPAQNRFKVEKHKQGDRVHFMQRSLEVHPETSRSIKSVRFDESLDEPKLNRKHSKSSILKNYKATKKPRFSDKLSMNNSICSNIMKDDQSTENMSFNKLCKQKYEKLLENAKKSQKKYSDQLFPQILSSISRNQDPVFKELKWVRLSELFAGKFLTVWDSNQSVKVLPGQYSRNHLAANCFNTIKHNNFLLQKMFESQKFNQNGIYYVKIMQNNSWKYIMVDDYIPVYKQDKKVVPAFLNVVCENSNHVQLWPFLLQKAFAKHYSNYECLQLGNQVDFIQELTGCYPEELDTNNSDFDQILHEINNYDSILIAKNYSSRFYPMVPRKALLTCEDPDTQYQHHSFTHDQFKDKFYKVYCVPLHKYFYSGFCTIKYNSKIVEDSHISMRCIKVEQPTQCVFSLVQKDAKHYYLSDYNYIWVRMIVIMKESEKNYRWLGGAYKNTKYMNLSLWLEPAQYMIIVIPEWGKKGLDLNLTFQGNIKVNIDRKPYLGNQSILIEAAMDLAQSKGRLKQLNPNICTYSYIQQNLGFIIQNINNERPNGFVRVLRSIEGLQKCGQNLIRAFNVEFRPSSTIQVKINSLQHFTVVLGVLGGINKSFLDQFDFGS